MAMEDKVLGSLFMAVATFAFLYYTVWTLVLPFVDTDHTIQTYFPDRFYAVAIPLTLLVVAICGVTTMLALVMIKSSTTKSKAVPIETKKVK